MFQQPTVSWCPDTHLEIRTTQNVDVEILPKDSNVLVLDTSLFIRVIRRTEVFAKVEGLFQVGLSLLEILRCSFVDWGADASALGHMFSLIDDGTLRQLSWEFVKGIFSLFDVHATRSGWAGWRAVGTLHMGKENRALGW
jgi:hypothetical protein